VPQRIVLIKVKDGLLNGLITRYFNWMGDEPPSELSTLTPVYEDISPWIKYSWWDKPAPGVVSEKFAVMWIGYLYVDKPGYYRFYIITDDGSRLWIDGKLVIDAWRDQPPTTYMSDQVYLTKGYHSIKYYYYNKYGYGEVVLGWIPPGGEPEVIPRDRFYHCIGDKVFFTNMPNGYVVKVSGVELIDLICVFQENICLIDLPLDKIPFEAVVKLYSDKGELLYESNKILLWGGDEYKFAVIKE